ncbi:MAG: cyclic nucleotide-binding domain-containing protein [Magnetococcus sp. THC-1_WYH]
MVLGSSHDEVTFDDLRTFFSGIPGFKNISEQDLHDLVAPIVCIVTYEAGQKIIHIGDPGDTLFLLYRGRIKGEIPTKDGRKNQFFIGSGEIFGEMALVSQARRSADISAVERCLCLTIDIESFRSIMKNHWPIVQAVAGMIGERIIRHTIQFENQKKTAGV